MKQFIVGSGWKMVKTYQDSIDTDIFVCDGNQSVC